MDYLETRIKQMEYLGNRLAEFGAPFQKPIGCHTIFLDAKKILHRVLKEEFQAQTLGYFLYLEVGVRGVEVGMILED